MSAKLIHEHECTDGTVAVFDSDDRLVVDVSAGLMSRLETRRMVAAWNLTADLTLEDLEALVEIKGVKA